MSHDEISLVLTGKVEVSLAEGLLHGHLIHLKYKQLWSNLDKDTVPGVIV